MSILVKSFQKLCVIYLTELRSQRQNPQATSELSLRAALDSLLQGARQLAERDVVVTGEGKKIAEGRPDFVVSAGGVPVGYIEAEKMDCDLDKLVGHAKLQNERFIKNLDHFLLTNHLDFRLHNGGKIVGDASLPAPPDKGAIVVLDSKAEKLFALLEQLIRASPPAISSPSDLAFHLSRRARQMNASVLETLQNPDAEIQNDYLAFRQVLLPNLTIEEFSDLYAQTFAYGLFAARCNFKGGEEFTRRVAADYLGTNPFLKKLFARFAGELDANLVWIADDMTALLATAPMDDIQQYFFKRTGNADPMIDFYEPFLRAYDSKLRDVRGVYYTPQPVVKYIVRSVHYLLQKHFGKARGLADEKTLVLDPATGTGSFLFTVIDQIHDEVTNQKGSAAWGGYVEKHLLNRIFGFELMVAPYSIAHLKLGLQLAGQGAPAAEGQRFGIYLTNTLDDAIKKTNILMGQFVSDEANAAVKIKNDDPILVILGNPPYSGHSANPSKKTAEEVTALREARKSGAKESVRITAEERSRRKLEELTYIGRLIEKYKIVDGAPMEERNSKWLQNDYIKFIAFAQEKINKSGEGVIGYITDNSYLDSPTMRGMRQSLINTFNEIFILDLHGNSKRKEKTPEGAVDQNVFEIQQGVAILLCVKEKGNVKQANVHYSDLWGRRDEKYEELANGDVSGTDWEMLQPASQMYFFVPQNTDLLEEYSSFMSVTEIFLINSVGVVTGQDKKAIAPTLDGAVELAASHGLNETVVRPILYRPFDNQFIVYDPKVVTRQRMAVMRHMLSGENMGLVTSRMTKGEVFAHTQVTQNISEVICMSGNTSNNGFIFPLYLYPDKNELNFADERRPNLSDTFLKALCERMDLPATGEHGLPQDITPEDIFQYTYAILHSPKYRMLYAPFLKTHFPRLPLTSDIVLFRDLAELGRQLVALHLVDVAKAPVLDEARHRFEGPGHGLVEKVEYIEATRRVRINATQAFEDVPIEVWEFRVGGYQVAEKWLKDRKGRSLSYDDITHYARVLIALTETIPLMQEIDVRIGGFPLP